MEYINHSGQKTKISDMKDAHLLNACAFYKKRLEKLDGDAMGENKNHYRNYREEVARTVNALKAEVERRNLV